MLKLIIMGRCLIIILRQGSKELTLVTVYKNRWFTYYYSIAETNMNTRYKVFTIYCNE